MVHLDYVNRIADIATQCKPGTVPMKSLRTTIAFFFLLIPTSGLFAADSTSVVKVGVTIRSRIETTDNAKHLNASFEEGYSYFRNRTGAMLQIFPARKYELGIRFTNEFRRYFVPEKTEFSYDEVVIDQFYAKVDSFVGLPLSLNIGRQNIILGEGFIVADGGPLDGSRTAYFDAAVLAWHFSPNTRLQFIYANQEKKDDRLPIIHEQDRALAEQDENAAIVYLTTRVQPITLESYVIVKKNSGSGRFPDADISCFGLRSLALLAPKLTWCTEIAGQLGDWGYENQRAIGGYSYFDFKTGWPTFFPNAVVLGGVYLSGDDPGTADHEAWEPMFGRWPKWSESFVNTLADESGTAYWSNFASIFGKVSAALGSDVVLTLEYHHLMAPQTFDWYEMKYVGDEGSPYPGGSGQVRGNLTVARLSYSLKPRLTGHLIFEQFEPGSYYAGWAEPSAWMRMEMMLTL